VVEWWLNWQRLVGVKSDNFKWFQATNRSYMKAEDELNKQINK